MTTTSSRYAETIVIGAGMAGLACASRLHENGKAVRVLEARQYVGGRIHSVEVNGSRLDTGANWIHGVGTSERPNPLMDILPHKRIKELNGMAMFCPPAETEDNKPHSRLESLYGEGDWEIIEKPVTTKSNEPLIIPSESAEKIQGAMWSTIEYVHEVADATSPSEGKDTSVLSALKHSPFFRDAFKELLAEHHQALRGVLQFIESMEAAPLAAQSAEHTQDTPGMSILEYAIDDFEGKQMFLQDGYLAIINDIAKNLIENGCIETGIEVEQITWETTPISIKTNFGTYIADNVVCTIPLGVLKSRQGLGDDPRDFPNAPMFTPALPRDKTEAISSLGFGTLDKVFLLYSSPWWCQEPYSSILRKGFVKRPFTTGPETFKYTEPDAFSGFTNELPGYQIHEDGNVTEGARLITITNLNSLSGFPALCAFLSCANANHIESFSDADAAGLLHRTLSNWFGQEPPEPQAVHVTRWAMDPYSLGSYSHMITGLSETRHREAFQEPIVNYHGASLRFAGEHTSKNHFATVHGALLSGWREADAIIKAG